VNLVDNGSDVDVLASIFTLSLFETTFAKEARNRSDRRGKLLDCSEKKCVGD